MNVGDKVRVDIQGTEVAQAEVKELGDGTVTVIIPATRVVMAMKSELAPEVGPATDDSGTQTIVDEVVRTNPEATGASPQAPAAPQANASGDVVPPSNDDAAKVITSSSVPSENDAAANAAKFDALDPKVQEQIATIVAEHLAAQSASSADGASDTTS